MRNLMIFLGSVAVVAGLTACAGYNPQSARVPNQTQCLTLQRQMLFNNNFYSGSDNQFKNQAAQQQLQKQFQDLHCYRVLNKVKSGSPRK
jgi:hypothetical protein